MKICDDDFLVRAANILGASSAASMAMAERARRIDAGEDAVVLWDERRSVFLVGPRPAKEGSP